MTLLVFGTELKLFQDLFRTTQIHWGGEKLIYSLKITPGRNSWLSEPLGETIHFLLLLSILTEKLHVVRRTLKPKSSEFEDSLWVPLGKSG